MSAAVAWGGAPEREAPDGHRRHPGTTRPGRPHLVLVPTGEAVPSRSGLRVTRAGRLVLTLGVLVAAAALTTALLSGGGGPVIDHSVTVAPGQTLSEVAAVELPDVPVAEGVARLQLVNDLPSAQVSAGEDILIPAG